MKKLIITLSLLLLPLVITGCNNGTPTLYHNDEYKGEPIKIADGLYFKKVCIQNMYVLLQCDKDGTIIHNQSTNMNVGYQQGKAFISTATLSPTVTAPESNFTFTFKCTEIDNCYEQILIVKNSLNK